MNILIVLNHMNVGGSQTQTISFAKFLRKERNRVFVASNGGELVKILNKNGILHFQVFFPYLGFNMPDRVLADQDLKYYLRVIRRLGFIGLMRCVVTIFALIYFTIQRKIDFIYANQPGPTLIAYFASLFTKIPFLFHVRGVLGNEFPPPFYRRIIKRSKKIMVDSKEVKTRLVDNFKVNSDKLMIVGHYIDWERFKPKEKNELMLFEREIGLQLGKKRIVHISTLFSNKLNSVKSLIEAACCLYEHFPDIQILIAGDGPSRKYVERLAERMNQRIGHEVITVIGKFKEVEKIINLADVIIGTGTVVLESIACSKPVVITSHYGFAGVATRENLYKLRNTNFTGRNTSVPVSPNSIEKAITKLLKDENFCNKIILEGRDFIKIEYGEEKKKLMLKEIFKVMET